MNETWLFSLAIAVGVIGLAVIGALVYFGWALFKMRVEDRAADLIIHAIHEYIHRSKDLDTAILTGTIEEYLSRRNEFWTLLGQFVLSILVVVVLTILLLVKAISAEAGLPILAGVGGFAIGKGVQTGRGITASRSPQQQG